jgi:hypothetical protein
MSNDAKRLKNTQGDYTRKSIKSLKSEKIDSFERKRDQIDKK